MLQKLFVASSCTLLEQARRLCFPLRPRVKLKPCLSLGYDRFNRPLGVVETVTGSKMRAGLVVTVP